ncbi:excalibur calcium-binding domain-containing protein [Flavobacterium sp.]|uniref:excalibur calcium-binding domain-containing protein n=1 Tax=Flavobacterium sp. TaxID=239 RepID=UPI0031D24FD8
MGYRRGYYRKDGTYVQGHFANNRSKFSNKNNGCLLLILILIAFTSIISCSDSSESNCSTKNCDDFKSRAEAQSAFENNKDCYKNLDADGDGIACENLK